MRLTFGFTGMDAATEAALKAAFADANTRTGGRWTLLPESEADYVVVDMDSMYGPMSWLRLHAAGKHVIGLTSAPRTQANTRLERPFDAGQVATVLQELGGADTSSQNSPAQPLAPAPSPSGMTAAPQPQDQLPEEVPLAVDEEAAPKSSPTTTEVLAGNKREPASAAAGRIVPTAPTLQPHVPAEPRTLLEWLVSGRLKGRTLVEHDGVALLIDIDQRQYYGPALLKGIAGHYAGALTANDFKTVDAGTWASLSDAAGAAQPLSRLVWFGGLLAGQGKLVEGLDPTARYHLLKWPQTEREFPKHFRVATAMMKGPATLVEVAEASGVPLVDVTDFVNASLATGFAEPYREPEPEPETPKPAGLFGRLRGR